MVRNGVLYWPMCAVLVMAFVPAMAAQQSANCKADDKDCTKQSAPPSQTTAPKSTSQKFPFPSGDSNKNSLPGDDADVPGEEPAPAAKPANPAALPPVPTDGKEPLPPGEGTPQPSSSSSQPAFSSSDPQANDTPAPTTQGDDSPVKAAPLKNLGARDSYAEIRKKLDKTRVPDDLKVAKFYSQNGNWNGALLRYQDATASDPENEEALYGAGYASEKLGKLADAKKLYEQYLSTMGGGDYDKEAREGLNRVTTAFLKSQAKK